jgi:hypothetical protein
MPGQTHEHDMPLTTIAIRIPDPDIPFEVASELLSYIAYPDDPRRRTDFSDVLCRAEHQEEARRNHDRALSPQLIRPQIFAATDDAFVRAFHYGIGKLRDRFYSATNMLMPRICEFVAPEDSQKTAEEASRNVIKMAQMIVTRQGLKPGNKATFIDDAWAPTKPVAHLAFAYTYILFLKPHISDPGWKAKSISKLISPYPDTNTVRTIMNYAETIRIILPELKKGWFYEHDTIQFVT